jgi:hypothetical protein
MKFHAFINTTSYGGNIASEDRQFTHSTLRERIVEHVFVGDVLRTLWRRGVTDVEILRPEFDAPGYDVVMSRGTVVRHVQLKTQAAGKVSVGHALADKPSDCVVWIGLNTDTLELGPYMWVGGTPGEPLPDISKYPNPKRPTHTPRASAQFARIILCFLHQRSPKSKRWMKSWPSFLGNSLRPAGDRPDYHAAPLNSVSLHC